MKKSKLLVLICILVCILVITSVLSSCGDTSTDTNTNTDTDTNSDTSADTNIDEEKYTVEFYSNGGSEVESQTVVNGKKAKEPTPPTKDGYTFDGWYVGTEKWSFLGHLITDNITLTAKWIANENTIVFDGNGHTKGKMTDFVIPTDEAKELPINAYEKAGYTFVGWSTVKDGEVEYENGANYQMGKESTYTLYAIWEANQNTLKFDGNGATSGEIDDILAFTDEKIILPDNVFENAGYTFKGWSDGNKTYGSGEEYTVSSKKINVFYAVWEANKNTLKFDGNGQTSGEMSDVVMATDEKISLPNNAFEKTGYTFLGWSTSTDGDVEYQNGKKYVMGTENTYVLYAIWEANQNTLKFDGNGSMTGELADMVLKTDETATLPQNVFEREGYTFLGWSTVKDGEVLYQDCAEFKMGPESICTLYVVWRANSNVLIFDGNGHTGGYMNDMIIMSGETKPLPVNTYEKKGYKFIGWSTTKNGEVKYEDGADYTMETNGACTLYAKWELVYYNITYVLNGGTNPWKNYEAYRFGHTMEFENPTIDDEDLAFGGWYLDDQFTNKIKSTDGLTGDITVYAKWVLMKKINSSVIESAVVNDENTRKEYVDKLFDGDTTTSSIYVAGTTEWHGNVGDTVTITFKEAVSLSRIKCYGAGNYTYSTITAYDANGNCVATGKILFDGGAYDTLTAIVDFEEAIIVKTLVLEITNIKWNDVKTHKISEVEFYTGE